LALTLFCEIVETLSSLPIIAARIVQMGRVGLLMKAREECLDGRSNIAVRNSKIFGAESRSLL
jgi:hypothetical protein